MIFAAIAGGVLIAVLIGRRIGDTVPMLLMLLTGVFMVFAAPKFPGSPIACLDVKPRGCTTSQQIDWVMALAFLVPMAVAVAYKTLRGDGRGFNGNWDPLQRIRGRR